jgi:hypothetical protein
MWQPKGYNDSGFWRQAENEEFKEDFPFAYNSAVSLRILYEKTITSFWKEEEND